MEFVTKIIKSFIFQSLLVFTLSVIIYSNTFHHEYALDDIMVIERNEYTQLGWEGIPDIMTKDAFYSYTKQLGGQVDLAGGRYRPLSIVTFAIEHYYLKTKPGDVVSWNEGDTVKTGTFKELKAQEAVITTQNNKEITIPYASLHSYKFETSVKHIINVILYALSMILLLHFLKHFLFVKQPYQEFLSIATTLLFLSHPIHTEVVANIKSRDEIMAFSGMIFTFICYLKYQNTKNIAWAIGSSIIFLLTMLSKEYGVMLFALLPLTLYFFREIPLSKTIFSVWPIGISFIAYLIIRVKSIGNIGGGNITTVHNDPYLYATLPQKIATKIMIMIQYVKLLIWPNPLSSDYSYKHFDYVGFSDSLFIASLVLHLGLLYLTYKLFQKRHILGYALITYFIYIILVNNFIFNIGAPMGERLVYHSSFGFIIIVAYGLYELSKKTNYYIGTIVLVLLTGIYSSLSYARNPAWKNNYTLHVTDFNAVPLSSPVNSRIGLACINHRYLPEHKYDRDTQVALLKQGIIHLKLSVEVNKTNESSFMNLGLSYWDLGQPDSAAYYWVQSKRVAPNNPQNATYAPFIFNYAMELARAQNLVMAEKYLKITCYLDDKNVEFLHNLAGCQYTIQKYTEAQKTWEKALKINPNHEPSKNGYSAVTNLLNTPKQP